MKFCKNFSRLSVVTRPMLPLGRLTVNVDHKTIYTWIKARKGKCNIKTQGEIQPWLFKPEINETYQFYYKSCISIWKETHDKAKKMSRDTKEPTNFLYFFTDMIVFDSSWNKKNVFKTIACWRQSRSNIYGKSVHYKRFCISKRNVGQDTWKAW